MPAPTGEVSRVANALVERIVSGAYPPGLRIPPELALAQELGCGRSTLREALQHMAGLGLVASRRGSGITVLDFRREGSLALLPAYLRAGRFDVPLPALAAELLRTRRMLAVEAARLAATYAKPESLGRVRALAKQLQGLEGDPAAHAMTEIELFRELLCASTVWPAVWFANGFWDGVRAMHEQLAGAIALVPAGHATMIDTLLALVARGQAKRAAALVDGHFAKVDEALLVRIERLFGEHAAQTAAASGAERPRAVRAGRSATSTTGTGTGSTTRRSSR